MAVGVIALVGLLAGVGFLAWLVETITKEDD